jgi:hypothetical protein
MLDRHLARTVFAACAVLASACSDEVAPGADESEATDEVAGETLRDLTAVRGQVNFGERTTVAYEPSSPAYAGAAARGKLPFLAVEIVSAAAASAPSASADALRPQNGPTRVGSSTTVSVKGAFPGAPRVLVVDENFKVLGATTARAVDELDVATLTAPDTGKKRFVLVRDALWVRPMTFDVTVGR